MLTTVTCLSDVHIQLMSTLEEVLWSDWGRPERIRETLEVLGKNSAFPSEILTNTNSRLNSSMEVGK